MALTYMSNVSPPMKQKSFSKAELDPLTLYYEVDRIAIEKQVGFSKFHHIEVEFGGIIFPALVGLKGKSEILPLIGLPCPPYYHEFIDGVLPLKILPANFNEGILPQLKELAAFSSGFKMVDKQV